METLNHHEDGVDLFMQVVISKFSRKTLEPFYIDVFNSLGVQ
jgi:hypothetical protein